MFPESVISKRIGSEELSAGVKISGDSSRRRDSMMSMNRGAMPFNVARDLKSLSASLTLVIYFAGFLMSFWAAKASRSATVMSSCLPRMEKA